MSILSMTASVFLIMNVLGHLPAILAMVKDIEPSRQRILLIREAFFSFLIASFYLFIGESFLSALHIQQYTMSCAGGAILLLVALEMIFPKEREESDAALNREPCIVPIALPMLSGAGIFTTIVYLYSKSGRLFGVWAAIFFSSVITASILFFAPFFQKILGKRGLIALEQLMGMIVVMMAVQMLVSGTQSLLQT